MTWVEFQVNWSRMDPGSLQDEFRFAWLRNKYMTGAAMRRDVVPTVAMVRRARGVVWCGTERLALVLFNTLMFAELWS